MTSTSWLEVIEAIVFRTIGDRPSPWESLLPAELFRLPEDLARVDALLDDPAFFAPFVPYFHPLLGRPSTPVECYLRLMFLKFRYRLGYESLCAEVSDSISWRRFCRIGLDGTVPHPTTLMKLTTRCGEAAVAGLNEALWAKAAGAKLLRTARVRADTTVIAANMVYPTDAGLLARAVGKLVAVSTPTGSGAVIAKRTCRRCLIAGKCHLPTFTVSRGRHRRRGPVMAQPPGRPVGLGRGFVSGLVLSSAGRGSSVAGSGLPAAGRCSCPGLCWAGLPGSGSWLAVRASRGQAV